MPTYSVTKHCRAFTLCTQRTYIDYRITYSPGSVHWEMLHQIQFLFSDVIFFLKREMIIFYFFSIVGRRKAILPSCAIISRLKEWVGGGIKSSGDRTRHSLNFSNANPRTTRMIRLHTKSNKYRSVNSNEMFVSQLTLQFLSIFLSRRVRCHVVLQLFWQPYTYWVTWFICTLIFKWGRGDRAAQKWGSIIQMARGVRIESCRLFSIWSS